MKSSVLSLNDAWALRRAVLPPTVAAAMTTTTQTPVPAFKLPIILASVLVKQKLQQCKRQRRLLSSVRLPQVLLTEVLDSQLPLAPRSRRAFRVPSRLWTLRQWQY